MRRPALIAALLLLMGFITATTVLNRIVDRLKDAVLPDSDPAVKAFESVRPTGKRSYLEALDELSEDKRRVCLVHPMGANYEHRVSGASHELRRSFDLLLLIGNEDISAKHGELRDQPDGAPSLLTLSEAAINAIALETLNLAGPDRPVCIPLAGAVVQLGLEETDTEGKPIPVGGRECWHQFIRISAGILNKNLY